MGTADWQRVKGVLADALEEPPETRMAFVERSCNGDTTLMREVEALLAQETSAWEQVAVDRGGGVDREGDEIGQRIGAYQIVREIGRGGMGAVYLGRRVDGVFDQEVAIKLLKRGTDTDEVLRRFRDERRILARLEHANIARISDAGTTENGLPYFVMEYIAGVPITAFVVENRLALERRLRLFVQVCNAVQFAHQNLVVHRDLKPANILVTAEAQPKLLDFGIAKVLGGADETAATMTLERRFTPICASPEQARGEPITTASDIYALGALLYELLTNNSPHQFSSPAPSSAEVTKVICDQTPMRPSQRVASVELRRSLAGDLDKIVLLALRKEPAGRYASAAAFAEDIQRYLDRRPIHARPHTAGYLTRRFIRRNRVTLGVAGTIGIAAVVLGMTAIWQWSKSAEHSAGLRVDVQEALTQYQDDWRRGNPVGALSDAQRALAASKELRLGNQRDPAIVEAQGYAWQCLAIAQRARGDLPGATDSYRKAEELYRSFAACYPATSLYAESARRMQRERAGVEPSAPRR